MSTQLKGSKSFSRSNYLYGLKNRKVWMILLIVNLFSIPYLLVSLLFFGMGTIQAVAPCGIALVIKMLMAIAIAFFQFDYCYDKTKVDMAYSIPLTRKQRFYSDFFSGLTMYVLGDLLQIVLSEMIFAIAYAVKPNNGIAKDLLKGGQFQEKITEIMVMILFIQIMLYVVTSFVIACTGALFEAITATIYVNILLASTPYMVYRLCASKLFGMGEDFLAATEKFSHEGSPLGGFLRLVRFVRERDLDDFWKWLFWYCCVIVMFALVTSVVMKRRKAQDVGKTFVVKPLYDIVLAAVMLHLGVFAFYNDNNVFSFLLLTLITYFVIEVVTNRGLKRMKQSMIRYGMIVTVTLGVIILINKTNCFGAAFYVADGEDVQEIEVRFDGLGNMSCFKNVTFRSSDNIQQILELQQKLINQYREETKHTPLFSLTNDIGQFNHKKTYFYMRVKENGKSYRRDYWISYQEMKDLVKLQLSEEYINSYIEGLQRTLNKITVSDVYDVNTVTLLPDTMGKSSRLIFEFLDAYKKDLKSTNIEQFMRPDQTVKYMVNRNYGDIVILPNYKYTLEFLQKYIKLPELSDQNLEGMLLGQEIYLIPPEDCSSEEEYTTFFDNDNGINENEKIIRYDESVGQLFSTAQIQYFSTVPCYQMIYQGRKFIIPKEYENLAKKIRHNNCYVEK